MDHQLHMHQRDQSHITVIQSSKQSYHRTQHSGSGKGRHKKITLWKNIFYLFISNSFDPDSNGSSFSEIGGFKIIHDGKVLVKEGSFNYIDQLGEPVLVSFTVEH